MCPALLLRQLDFTPHWIIVWAADVWCTDLGTITGQESGKQANERRFSLTLQVRAGTGLPS